MSKIAVIYWSQTGNTEAMAKAVAEGATAAGAEVTLLQVTDITASASEKYEKLALGCPSMGDEVLEEGDFEPFFTELESKLSGKKVALFGSYGWGDGQWMRDWVERTNATGAALFGNEGLIVNETPDDDGIAACRQFGSGFAAF